ncbi:MAG: STAS domain-containing protein [Oscillospiraceae bacterium]|nr:STAS domain-containing protein [Oscillospiraceae bacterium]
MTIKKEITGDKLTLTMEGRLDTATALQLEGDLLPALGKYQIVEMDFAEVSYVSSAGLRVLLMGEKAAIANNTRQTLRNVSPQIMDVFEITGFSATLNIE